MPAENWAEKCNGSIQYVDKNQIDYELELSQIRGHVIDWSSVPLPRACAALFTEEKDHKLIATTLTNEQGYFELRALKPGKYRLVVWDGQRALCPANVKIILQPRDKHTLGRRNISVHMEASGIDHCSWCELREN
jgi:hypothetical protein